MSDPLESFETQVIAFLELCCGQARVCSQGIGKGDGNGAQV